MNRISKLRSTIPCEDMHAYDCRTPASRSPTASFTFPTIPSFRSSKATARGPISGARASACSTPPSKRPTAASGRSCGRKCSPAQKSFDKIEQLAARRNARRVSRTTSSASRARSRRRSAAASARSTWRCGRCSICSSACGRCATSQGVPIPVKQPELVDMVIFRENTEDIYAGIEYAGGTAESAEGARLPRDASFRRRPSKVRFGTQGESRRLAEAARSRSARRSAS